MSYIPYVKLQSQTASTSSSIIFSSGITSAFDNYLLICKNVFTDTAGDYLTLQYSSNGGSSWITSGYKSGINYTEYNSNSWGNQSIQSAVYLSADLEISGTSSIPMSGRFFFTQMTDGTYPSMTGQCTFFDHGNALVSQGICYSAKSTSATVNAIKLFMTAGNIKTGTFELYGVT